MVQNIRLDHLSVCLSVCRSVRKVYCGKTAGWIRMPFGMVSGVGRGMGILDGWSGDRRKGSGSFGGEFVTNGAFATLSSQITLRTCYCVRRLIAGGFVKYGRSSSFDI